MASCCAASDRTEAVWLRFVQGRPLSAITIQFLDWCCPKLAALGVPVWALIWDNASWHVSKAVRAWIRTHNRAVKQTGPGRAHPGVLPARQESLAQPD